MSLRITKVSDYKKSNKNNQDLEKCSIHSSGSNKPDESDKIKVRYLLDSKVNIIEHSEETVSHGYGQYGETYTLKKDYKKVNNFEDLLLSYCETRSNPDVILYKKKFVVDFNNKNSNNLAVDAKQNNNNTVKYIPLERVNVSNGVPRYQNDLKVNVKIEETSKYNEPFKLFGVRKIETSNFVKDETKRESPVQLLKKHETKTDSKSEPTTIKDNIQQPKQKQKLESDSTVVTEPPPAPTVSTNSLQTLITSAINNKNDLEKLPASQTSAKLGSISSNKRPVNEKVNNSSEQTNIGLNSQRFLNVNPYMTKQSNKKIEFCDYRSLSNNAFANELKSHPLIKENN